MKSLLHLLTNRHLLHVIITITLMLGLVTANYLVQHSQDIRGKAKNQITTYEGRLHTIVFDDFENSTSHIEYSLKTDLGEIIPLEFNEDPQLKSNTKIRVSATKTDKKALVQNTSEEVLKDIQILESSLSTPAFGEKKVIAIMINFEDNPDVKPVSEAEVRNIVFTGEKSVNSYFQEVSYGKLSLRGDIREDGDIFGWYTIPFSSQECEQQGHNWFDAVDNAIENEGLDLSIYDHILHLWATGSCRTPASGHINGKVSDYFLLDVGSNGFKPFTVAHELGHNFGLMHANSYMCKVGDLCFNSQIYIGNNCSEKVYGDYFDLMGQGRTSWIEDLPLHTNAFFKLKLGWLEPIRVKTVTSDGIFTIRPTEISSTGFQLLLIPIQFQEENQYYFIEYRQPIGFDNYNIEQGYWMHKGIIIRISHHSKYFMNVPSSLLIDSVPANGCISKDATLQVGDTFVDQARGITIKLLSATSTEADVEIKFIDLNENLVLTNIPIESNRVDNYYRSCDERCSDFASNCINVGTDLNATNYLRYNNFCTEVEADCSTVMEDTSNICFGNKTDWTNCKCILPLPTPSPTPTSIFTPTPTPELPTPKPTCEIPGDGNKDCSVNGVDYVIWLNHYGLSGNIGPSEGDYFDDDVINGIDYVVWLNNYTG